MKKAPISMLLVALKATVSMLLVALEAPISMLLVALKASFLVILASALIAGCTNKPEVKTLETKELQLDVKQQSYSDTIKKLSAEKAQLQAERDELSRHLEANTVTIKTIQKTYETANRFTSADTGFIQRYFSDSLQ